MNPFRKKAAVRHEGRFCQECGHKKWLPSLISEQFCLSCKKNTVSNIRISISENISIRDSFKLRKKSPAFRRFAVAIIGGWFPSRDYKDGVEISRSLDKEKDQYDEIIKDHNTGKLIHENHEKLSEHTGHGSAKQ